MPVDIQGEIAKAREIIAALPQAPHIPPERVESWIARVLEVDPERIAWHAKRAGGFGSSEIGALALAHDNQYHPFNSARDIVASKLLILAPEGGSNHTQRGIKAEPFIQRMFFERFGQVVEQATDALNNLSSARHSKYPWKIASPDDITKLFMSKRRGISIVDYKAPKAEILKDYYEDGISIDYAAQLHHIRDIAIDHGYQVDDMMNVFFDYEGVIGTTMEEKMANAFNAVPMRIAYDPLLDATMNAAGERYWNEYVLQGRLPEYAIKPRFAADQLTQKIIDASRTATRAKILSDQFKKVADRKQDEIKDYVEDLGSLGEARVIFSGLEMSAKSSFDIEAITSKFDAMGGDMEAVTEPDGINTDALVEHLKQAGFDLSAFEKRTAPDPEKMVAWLDSINVDTTRMTRETMMMKLPSAKSGLIFEAIKDIRDAVDDQMPKIMEAISLEDLETRIGFAPQVIDVTPAAMERKITRQPMAPSVLAGFAIAANEPEPEEEPQLAMKM